MINIETFLSCIDCLTDLCNDTTSGDGVEYPTADSTKWRGQLMTFISLAPNRAVDIEFKLPEKVLDTSNIQQSGQLFQ